MTRFRRYFLFAAALIILVALMLGIFFQVFTQRALDRAEAFQFRRMLVTRQGEKGIYRFFYVTNRLKQNQNGKIEEQFGSEREAGLNFGYFDTELKPTLGVGMLINPTDWFQNEEIRLRDIQSLSKAEFINEIRKQVRASPYNSLLININGFRERFTSALRKTAFLAHVLDINSPFLVFDWPGNQGSTPWGYRRAQRVARDSAAELAETIKLISREVQPERLWIVANSMGAEVVVNAFSLLYEASEPNAQYPKIEHVVLTAPDVGYEKFGLRFKPEINALARDFTVYVSSNDRALLMSRVINLGEKRLGQSTLNPENPDQSDEAEKVLQMVEPGSNFVTLVDTTPVNRTRNFHNFSLETPEFFDDLFLLLTNSYIPLSRLRYQVRAPGGKIYWVLTRGR
jgi:esterase/lipase superfamily enzyme